MFLETSDYFSSQINHLGFFVFEAVTILEYSAEVLIQIFHFVTQNIHNMFAKVLNFNEVNNLYNFIKDIIKKNLSSEYVVIKTMTTGIEVFTHPILSYQWVLYTTAVVPLVQMPTQ